MSNSGEGHEARSTVPKEPFILGFYGPSGSGKTTLVEAVVAQLTMRGFRVAAIKHITHPNFTIDTPGKDTWRMAAAGAVAVGASAPTETTIMSREPMPIARLVKELAAVSQPNVILIEGHREIPYPKVMVGDTREEPNTVLRHTGGAEKVVAYILENVPR
ncbi:MAG: molybdopterin-guanine dinucleotide biosynthesis protein B [Euryarchaeota archaeon]|nr:molybdopterin-guanine dinucleotide biosynthesis protein B [Euryarchaeota archaeon]